MKISSLKKTKVHKKIIKIRLIILFFLFQVNLSAQATSFDQVEGFYIDGLTNKLINVVVGQSFNEVIDLTLKDAIQYDILSSQTLSHAATLPDSYYQNLILGEAEVFEINANSRLNSAVKIEEIKNISLAGLDVFSMGLDAYNISQKMGALWNGEGSWNDNIENTAGLTADIISLAGTSTSLASKIPSSAWAQSWAKSGFGKAMTGKLVGQVNLFVLFGQIQAAVYGYMRDNTIDEIKANLIHEHEQIQYGRKIQIAKLVGLFWKKMGETNSLPIGKGVLATELEDYLILYNNNLSGIGSEIDVILWEKFIALSNNVEYLQNEYLDFDSVSAINHNLQSLKMMIHNYNLKIFLF